MFGAENLDITKQNSSDPTTSAAGINARLQLHQRFDTSIEAISFPKGAQRDVQAVLSAHGALENALGDLAANVGSVDNYNSIFSTVRPAEGNLASAITALNHDIGVSNTNS
jgi:hypothetical protein